MNRSAFATLLAGGLAGAPLFAYARRLEGTLTSQPALFASLPPIAAGQWTRIILGSGALYQKQIGAGVETDGAGKHLRYLEMQIGSPGGSCNPSSMRKAYLRGSQFGSLLDSYALTTNIGRTENLIYRYGDGSEADRAAGTAEKTLRLLDVGYLYDPRPMRIISVAPQTIHAASRNVATTHVVAEFGASGADARHRMRRIELWHNGSFPFGVVKYRATLADLEPFEAHVYAFGTRFASLLPLSLRRVREMTAGGQYGQLPQGIGS